MPEQLEKIQQRAPSFLEHALAMTVTNEATKKAAAQVLVEAKVISRSITKLGTGDLEDAKKAFEAIKARWAARTTPFDMAYAHLERQIKAYWRSEYEAAKELMDNEVIRAESTGDIIQLVDLGEKTEKTELGQMQIKKLKTFSIGTYIKEGEVVEGADLSWANTDLHDLPPELFKLDLKAFKKLVETGLCKRADVTHQFKPSITVKES